MKTFPCVRPKRKIIARLSDYGWVLRIFQIKKDDYTCFVREDGSPRILLVDFILGRFILETVQGELVCEASDCEADPEYEAILDCLYFGPVSEALA